MKTKIISILIAGSILALTGCSENGLKVDDLQQSYVNSSTATKGAVVGGVAGTAAGYAVAGTAGTPVGAVAGLAIGGVVGYYLETHHSQSEELAAHGIQVIKVGDFVKLIIPSNQLFDGISDGFINSSPQSLDLVAKLIQSVPKITVSVSAYSFKMGSPQVADSVTKLQANHVAKYLWSKGIDTRLMVANGYGQQSPVVPQDMDSSKNYRVEITLRELKI